MLGKTSVVAIVKACCSQAQQVVQNMSSAGHVGKLGEKGQNRLVKPQKRCTLLLWQKK